MNVLGADLLQFFFFSMMMFFLISLTVSCYSSAQGGQEGPSPEGPAAKVEARAEAKAKAKAKQDALRVKQTPLQWNLVISNEDLGTMKITLLCRVSYYIRVKK